MFVVYYICRLIVTPSTTKLNKGKHMNIENISDYVDAISTVSRNAIQPDEWVSLAHEFREVAGINMLCGEHPFEEVEQFLDYVAKRILTTPKWFDNANTTAFLAVAMEGDGKRVAPMFEMLFDATNSMQGKHSMSEQVEDVKRIMQATNAIGTLMFINLEIMAKRYAVQGFRLHFPDGQSYFEDMENAVAH